VNGGEKNEFTSFVIGLTADLLADLPAGILQSLT
jgi:hypothetical protein